VVPQSPATRLPSLTASLAITRNIPAATAVGLTRSETNNPALLLSLCSSQAPTTSELANKSGQRSLLLIEKAELMLPRAALLLLTMDPKVSLKFKQLQTLMEMELLSPGSTSTAEATTMCSF